MRVSRVPGTPGRVRDPSRLAVACAGPGNGLHLVHEHPSLLVAFESEHFDRLLDSGKVAMRIVVEDDERPVAEDGAPHLELADRVQTRVRRVDVEQVDLAVAGRSSFARL